jgi:hypothetical protein
MHGEGRKSRETVGHSVRPVFWLVLKSRGMLMSGASAVKAGQRHNAGFETAVLSVAGLP